MDDKIKKIDTTYQLFYIWAICLAGIALYAGISFAEPSKYICFTIFFCTSFILFGLGKIIKTMTEHKTP